MKKNYILICVCILTNVFSSFSQSANWSAYLPALFPTNASGQIHGISRVSQLKFHPTNSSKMYAVSARGGLFISTNGGTNWTVAPGCDAMTFSTFASVCIDFTNDQIIYLGAGDHNYYGTWGGATGVWKSTNGGTTFTQTTLNNKIIVDMVMDPNDHNVIVAVTSGGIYKTTNAGTSWTLKTASREFDDLKQKTPVSRVLYAATTDSAFFRSTDFGDTWNQITSGIVLPSGITNGNGCRIAVTPADTNVVYLGMVANAGTIYKSTNGGTSFTGVKTTASPYLTYYDNASSSSGQGDYNFGIGVDRTNANILYLVAHNFWKSTDGGVNWTQMTNWWQEVHTDMHQVVISPYNSSQVWDMNDGGVWLSTDGGLNWNPKSDGIYGYEIYHGSCSPTRRDMISIGTQDNGELYASSSGWFTNRGGDWQSHCVFDYRANSSMVYYFDPDWGGIPVPKRRLVNGGDATYGLPASVTDFTDIAFNRSNASLAFVADTVIWRTTNLSVTTPSWTQILNTNKKIMTVHSSFADANRLYVITNDGTFYASTNALSASPTFSTFTLPNTTNNTASITTIKSSPNVVYVTCNTKVYRSIDNGANWTNITYNLPSVNHVRVLADEYYSSNELVFIASNNAVYYKTMNAASWTIYNTNLPSRTSIVDMSIYNDSTANTLLRVATYGRGVWETPITNLHTISANFAADNTNPCTGATVQFSDLSVGNVTSRIWSFPGGTPSTSTATNPSVVYSSIGSFNVTLTVSDGVTNSTATQTNYIVTSGGALPLTEGFEGASDPPSGWKNIDNGTSGNLWTKTSNAGGFGNSPSSMMFDNYSWNIPGQKDELQAKRISLSGYSNVSLTFDVAYQVYSGYSDSLAVLISTDCGVNFTRIFIKGGSTLSTAGTATADFIPTAAQWRTETVSLNPYVGQANVIVEFQNINGFGNKLYLDNINIIEPFSADAGIDRSICSGGSIGIGMTAAGGINYSWTPATGLSSSTVSNPTASPASTTTYILTATQVSSGAIDKDTVIVNVTATVNASVSIAASPAGAICAGTNVTFTATPTNGGSPPSYVWNRNGVDVGTGVSYSDATLTNGIPIKCFMTSTASCVNGSPATSNTITMVVNAKPTPTITGNTTICSGSSRTLDAGAGYSSYNWSTGATTQTISVNTASVFTVTVSNANGCTGTASVTTTSGSNPTPNISGTLSFCQGSSSTLNAGAGYSGYSWSTGATTQTIAVNTAGTFTVTVSNAAGCTGTDVVTTTLKTKPTPVISGNGVICPGNSTTLNAGTGYSLYNWSNGATTNSISVNTAATYTVTVTGTNGCTGTTSATTTIGSNPSTTITGSTSFCAGNSTTLNAGAGFSGYSWNTGATTQSILVNTAGTFTVTVSNVNGCTGTASATTSILSCPVTLHLKIYLEGFYKPGHTLAPVADPEGHPTVSDTIIVELHNANSPYGLAEAKKGVIDINGNGDFVFSSITSGASYYIAIRHRNSLETWSRNPVLFSAPSVNFDFTSP